MSDEGFPGPTRLRPVIKYGVLGFMVAVVVGGMGVVHWMHGRKAMGETLETVGLNLGFSNKLKERLGYMPEPERVVTPPKPPDVRPLPAAAPPKAAVPATPTTPAKAPARERQKAIYVVNEQKAPPVATGELYTLAAWTYIAIVLENVVVSELEGPFTVKTTRPVYDVTGQHLLIPQGTRIGAQAETAELLLGNERIPGFSLSLQGQDGHAVELGKAPVMDATGTNGLRAEVDNHTFRLLWTSLFIRGLESGQQVIQAQMGPTGLTPLATGLSRGGSDAARKRLGRAQDTRPTLTASSGELGLILMPKALSLPSVGRR